jgi:CheY-specific phosphatase CheX
MTEHQIGLKETMDTLSLAAEDILEQMFFFAVDSVEDREIGPADDTEPSMAVEIEFRGAHSGCLGVVVAAGCGRELAAGFSGVIDSEEIGLEQVTEVLREMANIMCGATLTRLAPQAVFDLASPRLLAQGELERRQRSGEPLAVRRLRSGTGWLELYWHWEEAP